MIRLGKKIQCSFILFGLRCGNRPGGFGFFTPFPASSFSHRFSDRKNGVKHPSAPGQRLVPSKDDTGRLNPRDFAVAGTPHRLSNPHRKEETRM
jgi:hypothetical protein